MGRFDDDGFLYIVRPQGRHDHQRRDERLPVGDRERAARASGESPTSPSSACRDDSWGEIVCAVSSRSRAPSSTRPTSSPSARRGSPATRSRPRCGSSTRSRARPPASRASSCCGSGSPVCGRDTSARGLSDRTVGVRRREKQHHQGVEPTVRSRREMSDNHTNGGAREAFIGVDVGGTHTDVAVIVPGHRSSAARRSRRTTTSAAACWRPSRSPPRSYDSRHGRAARQHASSSSTARPSSPTRSPSCAAPASAC